MDIVNVAKKTAICLGIFVLSSTCIQAQYASSAIAHGLGGTAVNAEGVRSLCDNSAGLVGMTGSAVGIHSRMPFSVAQLASHAVCFGISISENASFNGTISSQGFEEFRRSTLLFGYSRVLFPSLKVSAGAGVSSLYVQDLGMYWHPQLALGMQFSLVSRITIGFHSIGVGPVRVSDGTSPGSRISGGVRFEISSNVDLHTEYTIRSHSKGRFKAGLAYRSNGIISFSFGASFNPSQIHIGATLVTKSGIEITTAAAYNTVLGITPALGVTFAFTKNEDPTGSSDPG